MGQLEYNVMLKMYDEQKRTNELLQEIVALLKPKESQQPVKEVVSNKLQSGGVQNGRRKPRSTTTGKSSKNGNK